MTLIPVTLVTGFLGAGKTSFLNALLRDPRFEGTAVLVNEFGEVSIDHDLVAGMDGDMVTTTTGCLCCTASSEAKQALFDLWNRRKSREIRAFKRVLIETTGLADPAPVIASLLAPPTNNLMDRIAATQFALSRVVTLVDGLHGEATIERHPEPPKQTALADLIVVTKVDLMSDPASLSDIKDLRKQIDHLNPSSPVLDRHADWPAIMDAMLEGGTYDVRTKGEDVLAWLSAERVLLGQLHDHDTNASHSDGPKHDHSHHVHDHHHHDLNRHHSGIQATAIVIDEPLEPARFYLFLQALRMVAGPDLLRVKGLAKLKDDPTRPVVVHGVQSQIHEIDRLDAWPSEDERTRFVLIGTNLDIGKLRSIIEQSAAQAGGGSDEGLSQTAPNR